jgi:hypothetical protein
MTRKAFFTTAALLAGALLTGCSSAPPPPKAEKKPAEPVAGQAALFEMYRQARQWMPEAMLLKLEAVDLAEPKAADGKYGAWRATFVTLVKRQQRQYTYSVADSGGFIRGVRPGEQMNYLPSPAQRAFAATEVKVDSPQALETARKEGKDYAAKNPDMPIQMHLDWPISQVRKPAWRVIWGTSASSSNFSVFLDATDGKFIKKTH